MRYPKDFFELQLRFARRVAAIGGIAFERAILDYTNIYVRLGIGRGFDAGHPVWLDYVEGLRRGGDATDWTYRFYLRRPESEPPGTVARFGCFSYAVDQDGRVRLHFENRDTEPCSPLSAARVDIRREELRALLAHVEQTRPDVQQVSGVSWLYNLPAYRRLFPETYLASARIAGGRLRNMPLWGQFLDRHGTVRPAAAQTLHERLSRQTDLRDLAACFPLQPLAVTAPISDFRRFLGL
ncbi:hypothetical protein SAMN02745126_06026 [Enhydrobacter aerosaccus]|uniref:Uncharacterized protein n=1 Tax=Enhydrobacter aerosaccus TaxID=225324 RepID=A0A1T4TCK9_9HYPH|nr:hypothetical protein [Enhydrobacter aerosaccus]SKA38234.1 hypothetical protein SAMN02745126_06026 [Enhydrobacter aerosaccus]